MRTKTYKTLNGWLNYLTERHPRANGTEVYETLEDFCKCEWEFNYFKNFAEPGERYVHERVVCPWELKYPVCKEIVDFHWGGRTKAERERIATALAQGEGDLSFLHCFQLEMRKTNGKWEYDYCTSSLSGPNYDYCKRKYLQSI